MMCEVCKKAEVEVDMHMGPTDFPKMCWPCADAFMRALAPSNVLGGSTVEETAAGYMLWRLESGHPCTHEEALEVARAPMNEEFTRVVGRACGV